MDQLKEYKSRKEGKVTPKYLMEHVLGVIEEDDSIESITYVAKLKDGTISSGWTDMMHTEVIGMYEVGKLQVIKDMWSEWEPR
ncbi:hypothetical protein [Paenibacillus silviterrae]|uniref:hypothetical protein n=1 Tax=Paenibacillus silviterrae TaxID=3242194 RepID=UPI00254392B8|nr:hypothetical protein [Paenibacillus chinjuensis]